MRIGQFLKDKLYVFVAAFFFLLFLFLFFFAFKVPSSLVLFTLLFFFSFLLFCLTVEYLRKKSFYDALFMNVKQLDQAYLVLEMIDKPTFYEGELWFQLLYTINKSMNENVQVYEEKMLAFKEYIEMWIHEIKLPISSLLLRMHNQKDRRWVEELKRMEDAVEQVLYYTRSENAGKDYLIMEVSLDKIIKSVALKNKDYLLENKIDLQVLNLHFQVFTDSKWLEFILNQIVNNSIKYRREEVESYIQIEAKEEKNTIILSILDNGIGIPASDISKVFDKSFTGQNGRIEAKATGMGLFIAKKMCQKLGHDITIESKKNAYTKVYITFSKNKFYEVIR